MRKILLLMSLLVASIPASSVERGRLKIDQPGFGDAGGIAQYNQLRDMYILIGDNLNSRYSEFSGVTNSQTLEVDHNFGINLTEINVLIYDGVSGSLTRVTEASSPALSLYTIQEKTGSEKLVIEVITPGSGTPTDLAIVVVNNNYVFNDLTDANLSGAEDGQAVVFDNATSTWVPGSSGDSSLKIQSVTDPNVTIKGGQYDIGDGRQLATYDGAGSASTDFKQDIVCDFDTLLGSSPADDTIYLVYIDINSVGTTPTTTSDTKEELYPVECADIAILTSFPEDTIGSRYVRVGRVHSATTGNVWSGTGSSFGTFATRIQSKPIVNTSPIVYTLAEQAIGAVGTSGQITGGHILVDDSFNISLAADAGSYWNLGADVSDDSVNSNALTALGGTVFDRSNIFGSASSAGGLNGASGDIFQLAGGFIDPIDNDTALTIAGWYEVTDYTPGAAGYLFAVTETAPTLYFSLSVETTGDIKLTTAADTAFTLSDPGFVDDSWHHFALTQTAKSYELFIDGESAATGTTANATAAGTSFLGIGGDGQSTNLNLDTAVQDFVLIKSVLSGGEIQKLASSKITHSQNIATSDQDWLATFSGDVSGQLDNDWVVDKSVDIIWFDFFDLVSTDLVSLKLKNENATTNVIPLKTFDTGFLSAVPSFPLSHGLGSIPTAVEVIHEEVTPTEFVSVADLCDWGSTSITCAGLATVDGTHRIRFVLSVANVAAAIGAASATEAGIVTLGAQTLGTGDKTISGGNLAVSSGTITASGNITSSAGNIAVSAGNLTVDSSGSVNPGIFNNTNAGQQDLVIILDNKSNSSDGAFASSIDIKTAATTGLSIGVHGTSGGRLQTGAAAGESIISARTGPLTLSQGTALNATSVGLKIDASKDVSIPNGNLTVNTGNITSSTGTITASGNITSNSGNITASAGNLTVQGNVAGDRSITLSNQDGGAGSHARLSINAGTGDPKIQYDTNTSTLWMVGVDNSDSDIFKITNNATGAIETTPRLEITQAGIASLTIDDTGTCGVGNVCTLSDSGTTVTNVDCTVAPTSANSNWMKTGGLITASGQLGGQTCTSSQSFELAAALLNGNFAGGDKAVGQATCDSSGTQFVITARNATSRLRFRAIAASCTGTVFWNATFPAN